MALDRLPGAARGDPHLLVVVALGAAGGERVAQPEVVLQRDVVGDVGERRGALVGRHDQVRIIAVVANHAVWRDDLALDDVVGDVEHARQERLVAVDGFGLEGLPAALWRRALEHEAALRPDRDDQRVLDHLGLHQAEDLGAEVLAAVRPADPAPRHPAAPQVDPLDPRRVDEDLELRSWQRKNRNQGGVELERQVEMRLALRIELERVGADGGADNAQEAAQDPVLVEARDGVERLVDLGRDPLRPRGVGAFGVQARGEQLDQQPRDVGVGEDRALDVGVREADPALAQVLGDGADDRDLPSGQGGGQDQAVQPIVLELAARDAEERVVQEVAHALEVLRVGLEPEVVDPHRTAALGRDLVGALVGHLGPQVLERGEYVGQQYAVGAEQLEPDDPLG